MATGHFPARRVSPTGPEGIAPKNGCAAGPAGLTRSSAPQDVFRFAVLAGLLSTTVSHCARPLSRWLRELGRLWFSVVDVVAGGCRGGAHRDARPQPTPPEESRQRHPVGA